MNCYLLNVENYFMSGYPEKGMRGILIFCYGQRIKKMNYDTLKTDFRRCLKEFREIYPEIDELCNKTVVQPS